MIITNQILYLKYGELTLKGKNRINFINRLYDNVKKALKDFNVKIIKAFDNIQIFYDNSVDQDLLITILKKVSGIS